MKEYLTARKAASSVSCMDLMQESKDAAQQEAFVCAAKCLFEDAESQAVGLAEADILKQLHAHPTTHPGRQSIVDFFGLYDQNSKRGSFVMEDIELEQNPDERQEGLWTLLLEYCQHGSIWDWIRQHPERVGFSQWLTWALQLLEAVDFIHESGLVHHDIKPHNILLNTSLGAKLSDFGASRFLVADTGDTNGSEGEDSQTPSLLQFGLHEGVGRGTPPYSAPEMFASASSGAHYGQAIDIYSLGVSLYVIGLTAHEPFHKLKSVMEMIVWIKKGGFWLWEDQNWIHDRGPIPKATPSSRLSNSAAALAQAQGQQGQGQGLGSGVQGRAKSGLSRSSSTASLAPVPNLPPINTQLFLDGSLRSQSSASSINSPGATTQHSHLRDSPMSVPQGLGGQFLAGYSPEPSYRHSQPSTPVSPLPFPSPVIRAQSSRASLRKEESRKSGEIVMRFLNGEVVPPNAIQLLKDMCQADPAHRPTAKQVLGRLQEMKAALDVEAEAELEEEDMDITGNHD
ncbi:hypothetical protein BGZ70_006084 [Mortierella alpina]|uniref:Protein kinase domain-containing protein n=1 Tax=Mortierella alpina TaxID=64518 RepID=A0A9P6M459_MORAP|nr:hypothetical protein BGZ70_006084 [Mortierella alpina]